MANTTCTITHVGDYQCDKRRNTVTLGSFYPRVLKNPRIYNVNLDEGLDYFEDEYGYEKLETLLEFIERTAKPDQTLKEAVQSDFVSNRGLLKYMVSKQFKNEPFTILAARFNGVIFMCEEQAQQTKPISRNEKKGKFYGAKFQEVMTNPTPGVVSNEKQSRTVLRGFFEKSDEKHSVLYSGQVDGIDESNKRVEMRIFCNDLNDYWLENRSMIWFLQAFLTDIDTIIVGQRHYNRIEKTYPLRVSDIPRKANDLWLPEDCFDCLHSTLSDLKKQLSIDGSAKILRFENQGFSSRDVEMSSRGLLTNSFMERFGQKP